MFKGNNQYVSAGLGATKVMIFVAVVLKIQKSMKLGVCYRLQKEMPKRWEIPKRPRLKEFKSTRTVRYDLNSYTHVLHGDYVCLSVSPSTHRFVT